MANMGYDENLPSGAMSERVHSPWQGDYDFPGTPAAVSTKFYQKYQFIQDINHFVNFQEDEQQVDESDEQFEERVLNKRAYQMFTVVRSKLKNTNQITLTEMCFRNTRKQVRKLIFLF